MRSAQMRNRERRQSAHPKGRKEVKRRGMPPARVTHKSLRGTGEAHVDFPLRHIAEGAKPINVTIEEWCCKVQNVHTSGRQAFELKGKQM